MRRAALLLFAVVLFMNQLNAQSMDNAWNERRERIATIAVNTAMGDLEALQTELAGGLVAGLTVNEIKEILIQLYAYCGFPRSLQGINTFMALMEERKAAGMEDVVGEEPTPVTGSDKYQQGKSMLEELTHRPETRLTGANAFAPGIDTFLKEHLFADIFGRGVLDYRDRELATVSALIGLGGVDPMLQSHLNMSMNVGLTEAELRRAIQAVSLFTGTDKARNAGKILDKVIESRK